MIQSFQKIQGKKNSYQILESIGVGNISQVFKGINLQTQEQVAVKVISKVRLGDQRANLYYEREIEVLKILKKKHNYHNNIIKVFDVFESNDTIFAIFELLVHGNLIEYMCSKNMLIQEKQAVDIIYQVTQAICHLHKMNIIHRDIKPENILLIIKDENVFAKIIDFGVSSINKKKQASSMVGSISYISKEVLEHQYLYNEKCDVWSLGCLFHELITGNQLFCGQAIREIYQQILKFEKYDYESKWKNIIQRCLEVDIQKRLSCEELQELLAQEVQKIKKQNNNNNYDDIDFIEGDSLDSNFILRKNLKVQEKQTILTFIEAEQNDNSNEEACQYEEQKEILNQEVQKIKVKNNIYDVDSSEYQDKLEYSNQNQEKDFNVQEKQTVLTQIETEENNNSNEEAFIQSRDAFTMSDYVILNQEQNIKDLDNKQDQILYKSIKEQQILLSLVEQEYKCDSNKTSNYHEINYEKNSQTFQFIHKNQLKCSEESIKPTAESVNNQNNYQNKLERLSIEHNQEEEKKVDDYLNDQEVQAVKSNIKLQNNGKYGLFELWEDLCSSKNRYLLTKEVKELVLFHSSSSNNNNIQSLLKNKYIDKDTFYYTLFYMIILLQFLSIFKISQSEFTENIKEEHKLHLKNLIVTIYNLRQGKKLKDVSKKDLLRLLSGLTELVDERNLQSAIKRYYELLRYRTFQSTMENLGAFFFENNLQYENIFSFNNISKNQGLKNQLFTINYITEKNKKFVIIINDTQKEVFQNFIKQKLPFKICLSSF